MQLTKPYLANIALTASMALIVVAGGCGTGSNETVTAADSDPKTKTSPQIAVVYYASEDPFSTAVRTGAEAAAEQYQRILEWHLPAEGDETAQQARFEQAMNDRVAGICVCSYTPTSLSDLIQLAAAADIPVVAFERPVEPSAGIVTYAGTDHFHCGRILIDAIAAANPDGGRVLVLRHADNHPGAFLRQHGMIATAKEKQGLDLVLSDSTVPAEEGLAIDTIASWIAAQGGGLTAVCGLTAKDTIAAVGAVKQLDLSSEVTVYGFGATEKTADLVRQGQLAGVVLEDPYMLGYSAIMAMADHLVGAADSLSKGDMIVTGEHFVDAHTADNEDNRRRFETNVRSELEN